MTFQDYWRDKKNEITEIIQGITTSCGVAKQQLFADAFFKKEYDALRPELKAVFKRLTPKDQEVFLKAVVAKGIEENNSKVVNRALHFLSNEELKELLQNIYTQTLDISDIAEKICDRFDSLYKHRRSTTNAFIHNEFVKGKSLAKRFIFNCINTLLAATHLFDLDYEPEGSWETTHQLTIYAQVLALPVAVFWGIHRLVPSWLKAGTIFALTMFSLASALYAYIKWIQPPPSKLPYGATNLTLQAECEVFGAVIGRDREIDALISQLVLSAQQPRQHPLLVGATGVGKDVILRGLAYRVSVGDVPDVLKGAQVFLINMANLSANQGIVAHGNITTLNHLSGKIGHHKNKTVVFLNEIHSASANENLTTLTGLLSLLDDSAESLPLCGAVTSLDKFDLIKDQMALMSRFAGKYQTINTMDEGQTLETMQATMERNYPEIGITETVLRSIFRASQGVNNESEIVLQPTRANSLLIKICSEVHKKTDGSTITPQITALEEKLGALKRDLNNATHLEQVVIDTKVKGIQDGIKATAKSIKEKKLELEEFKIKVEKHRQIKARRMEARKTLYKIATSLKAKPKVLQKELELLFHEFILASSITEAANNFAKEHGLETKVTEEDVQRAVAQYAKSASEPVPAAPLLMNGEI